MSAVTESTRERAQLLRGPALTGLAGAGAFAALHFRDPHEQGSWGACPFLALTGQPCPGCGGLRAVNDLTNGDIGSALTSNAMAVVLVAVLGAAWVVWAWRRARGRDAPLLSSSPAIPIAIGVGFAVFGVFRWTPWGAGLYPA